MSHTLCLIIWHPDKNEHPDANKIFVKIKQAYELLSDPDRRRMYDQHGIRSEDSHFFAAKSDLYRKTSSEQFENFFGKQFNADNDISFYHRISITIKNYEKKIVPNSKFTPYIVMFYNDWCFRCTRLISVFKRLIDALEPLDSPQECSLRKAMAIFLTNQIKARFEFQIFGIKEVSKNLQLYRFRCNCMEVEKLWGINFAAVNAAYEPGLVKKSGVSSIPSLVIILDGHCYIYRENVYTLPKIKEFIRKKMPYSIKQRIYDHNVEDFLGGWIDNRVRALILEPRNKTRLRYLISAYSFQYRVAFGFIDLNDSRSEQIQKLFKVSSNLDTLLMFNEDSRRPRAQISLPEIPVQTLNDMICSNQYLSLPRLSSQQVMEGVCPAEWSQPRKRLCVILITENNDSHNFARSAFRNIALQAEYSIERVRFAYIFKEKQKEFINAISKGAEADQLSPIVIIWRYDQTHIKYEWVKGSHLNMDFNLYDSNEQVINLTRRYIDNTIQRLLRTSETFSYETFVKNLFDEHAQSLINRWLSKVEYISEYLNDNLEKEHVLALLSLLGTIIFMFAVGYVMVYFVRVEEENLKQKGHFNGSNSTSLKQSRSPPELKLHELRAEKYNGMVRLLKPGCRTIILLTDIKTRPKLIPSFHKAVWPYRKSKTLLFGHMLIEKGLLWYSELLRLSLCESKTFKINPRNCVGTVIALNGHRKYFCMYHAKHPETNNDRKRLMKMKKHLERDTTDPEVGAFVEVHSDESDCEQKILLEENLLDGLSNWLDRLFEGSTHRYSVNYWPDFPTK
ncbi:dnaJ homolog subfamily C member 16 isoform X2 [Bactrocera dorsalis]|uniref:DnaJ homolog subfamily C member 16 isoform X2 n=1 Tax=Bactrocera dorsalis TaxID=27457 RepID=A0ABM3J9K0_BACDO|nr:dnaJ homolog subfamily C member 16 isoform X2 [Bactrocera dorsalis]XP_049305905.1 dnaJ homolog subfamily C member 16 isoform X2 [Bactrocera dorsalis]XP_049305906.1 dnaJ homolog subfamily C member 16 isoform X2 [Bactrocera dorsalis]